MPSKDILEKREKAKEVVDILEEISTLLVSTSFPVPGVLNLLTKLLQDTDLSRVQLSMCVSLVENGVNPEALAVSGVDFDLGGAD